MMMVVVPLAFRCQSPEEVNGLMSLPQTVYIVDDDENIRKAIALLLKSAGLTAEQYASADEFLKCFDPDKGGCLVVDVRMPGMSGLELQDVIRERQIVMPVIIMTGHGDVAMAVKAMKAGAVDFIEKPFKNQELLDRIEQCLSQSAELQVNKQHQLEVVERIRLLTGREREVMELLVAGKLNKQVAAELDISTRTVEAHRARIMDKLQAKSFSEVVRIAMLV
jgi:two-component system response regulator FixJ